VATGVHIRLADIEFPICLVHIDGLEFSVMNNGSIAPGEPIWTGYALAYLPAVRFARLMIAHFFTDFPPKASGRCIVIFALSQQ
jgi:hypothetical protein